MTVEEIARSYMGAYRAWKAAKARRPARELDNDVVQVESVHGALQRACDGGAR